jgi:hypothetical protein
MTNKKNQYFFNGKKIKQINDFDNKNLYRLFTFVGFNFAGVCLTELIIALYDNFHPTQRA